MLLKTILFLLSSVLLSGCSPTKLTIKESGPITQPSEARGHVEKIQVGMSEVKVKQVKGDPDIVKRIKEGKFIYYYWETREHERVVFEGGKVVKIGYPPEKTAVKEKEGIKP